MVVAGEAGEAVVVVKPLGLTALAALDIAYGTDAGATSALDAAIGLSLIHISEPTRRS